MSPATDADIAAAIAAHRAARAALYRHAAQVAHDDPAFADDLIEALGSAALEKAERAAFAALIDMVPESRKGVAMIARYLLAHLESLDAAAVARWLASLARGS